MARKDVLKGLMGGDAAAPLRLNPEEPAPRPARGAIGAVSRSIADLKARSVMEIDPTLIEAGGLPDRLEHDEEANRLLRDSIATYGQQVPVLVRPHPEKEGRFQIVYGRRRLLALRELSQPVKALVRELDDRELVLAQGQENSARRDLSFIEKVNFAGQMEAQGYDRKIIGDALSIDKTLVSRMLSVAGRVPMEVIAIIGAAPSIGRDRWLRLAELLDETGTDPGELSEAIESTVTSLRSDDRFQIAWAYLHHRQRDALVPQQVDVPTIRSPEGMPLAQVKFDSRHCTIKLRLANTEGFEAWLLQSLPGLFADWRENRPATDTPINPTERRHDPA